MIDFFSMSWGQEIAEISTQPEFQAVVVRVELKNPEGKSGEFNFETNEYEDFEEPVVLYEGPARFAPIRWGVDSRNTHIFNSSTTTRLRFQFPYGVMQQNVPAASRIWIVEAPRSPHMIGGTAVVTADVQNSDNGARTLETEWNSDDGANQNQAVN